MKLGRTGPPWRRLRPEVAALGEGPITDTPPGGGHHGTVGLWIAGAGGVGREALDVALFSGGGVEGFVDDQLAGEEVRGLPVISPDDLPGGALFIVAIGDPRVRIDVAGRLAQLGHEPVSLVDRRAIVGPETTVGAGCLVSAGAFISSSVTLGDHVQVHYNATVGHDCVLDEGATVLPGANVAGSVHVGRAATIGSAAVVLQGLSIGEGAMVGAGAVVTKDVAAGVAVVGSPARPLTGR